MVFSADGYCFRPVTESQVRDVVMLAGRTGRRVTLRGSGNSYGDANIGAESLILDCSRMNRILDWNPSTGIIEVEAGVTVEGLWRHCLDDGYWPPVVSGTMFPTVGGALGMNIHGKNNSHAGPLGDHVLELRVMDGKGEVRKLGPDSEMFRAVIGGAGLFGVILTAKLQMRPVVSGNLRVLEITNPDLHDHFVQFEHFRESADYMVSWVDCFARGARLGRGQMHIAWYGATPDKASLSARAQDLPDTILGFFPKTVVWRILRRFNNRLGMRLINWAKYCASAALHDGKTVTQGLVAFSFLLDYVPNWRQAYSPGGFIQYQTFVPKENAERVFRRQLELQHQAGVVSFLGVMKRHRPDKFLLSHAVDGFSLALDFKVTPKTWPKIQALAHQMNDVTLDGGGRFYFAKDCTLRPEDARAYLGEDTLASFRRLRAEADPDRVFTTQLAKRLELD
jgi:decaprenylphospho-beta-D-ribofuranose 2-oxidase